MNSPLFSHKFFRHPSVFTVEGLLREARRQKCVPSGDVPRICLLDPDGDLCRELKLSGAENNPHWACYHTEMLEWALTKTTVGVVGCAVGASFATLVAEEMFASGCELLISVTSAGQINDAGEPPYFVFIDRALRDEGTSYHYLPPEPYVHPAPEMTALAKNLTADGIDRVISGGAWTTDAPFRETEAAIAFARSEGLLAVEMEAAALYAFAEARRRSILCFAHVTNRMATVENDFEKGEGDGNKALRGLIERIIEVWEERPEPGGANGPFKLRSLRLLRNGRGRPA